MKYLITVTQEDIDKGERSQTRYCPIALAAQRTLGEKVRVTGARITTATVTGLTLRTIAYLPTKVIHFVRDFDNGLPLYPFEFEIDTELHQ